MRQTSLLKPFLIATFIVILGVPVLPAQEWSAHLTVDPMPGPYLSAWQTDPTLASLEIVNPTDEADVGVVFVEITDGSGSPVLQADSRHLLVQAGQSLLLNATGYTDWNVRYIGETVQQTAVQTGMFPEDDYEVCVQVRNLWGDVLAPQTCAFLTVIHPEPPELIFPTGGETVYTSRPLFQWLPPQVPVSAQIVTTFRLVELLDGQIPQRALEANTPHYENFNLFDSDLEYPLDGLPLEAGKRYVWQVQALDFEGRPATKNDGKSPVGVFTVAPDAEGVTPRLELLEPEDGTLVQTARPRFHWLEPLLISGGTVNYELKIARVEPGQTAEDALDFNPPLAVSGPGLTQPEYTYPPGAPGLDEASVYAWRVRALDESGLPATAAEGYSEARTFTVALPPIVWDDPLPEKLPVLNEDAAYIELKRDGAAIVDFTAAPDSSSITVRGAMTLVLPALNPADAPSAAVNGEIVFDPVTRQILSGSFTGQGDRHPASPLNLNPLGAPLIITDIAYDATSPDRLHFQAAPSLFGRTESQAAAPLEMLSDGSLQGDFYVSLSETAPLSGDGSRLAYAMHSLSGRVDGPAGALQTDLTVEGDLVLSTETQSVVMPVPLKLTPDGAQNAGPGAGAGDITLPVNSLSMNLSGVSCRSLAYDSGRDAWSFDLAFGLTLGFNELGLTLPEMQDVHMSRFGIEIPQMQFSDLGIEDFSLYGDAAVRPAAFRMYAHVFDWLGWSGGSAGDWGLFFDVEIRLPGLPSRLAVLNDAPFRANNAVWENGAFRGAWNVRSYAPAPFIPAADTVAWGFAIGQIQGAFEGGTIRLGVEADFEPPQGMGAPIPLDASQLTLTPRGLFTGRANGLAFSDPISWTGDLAIRPGDAALIFSGSGGRQQAVLDFTGSVDLPEFSGTTVQARGEGVFDLMTRTVTSGAFIVADGFTLGLPPDRPLLGVECDPGAVLDATGLHIQSTSGQVRLSSGDPVACTVSGPVDILLPQWRIESGVIDFQEPFALNLQDWSLGASRMLWQSLPQDAPPSAGDWLHILLPGAPRVQSNRLTIAGISQARFRYQGQEHDLEVRFSQDFLFTVSPSGVAAGEAGFYLDGEQVALLDVSGLHLGEHFGGPLAEMKIGLPDTSTAYVDLKQNPQLIVSDDNGLVRIQTSPGETATILFPGLTYGATSPPSFTAELDLTVDPSTYAVVRGHISAQGDPLLSLAPGSVPLEVTGLDFRSGKWTASLRPLLPRALRGLDWTADDVPVSNTGLPSLDRGYSAYTGAPADSAVLGDCLLATLDGMRIVTGGTLPDVKISGDFRSALFGGAGMHYTAELAPDSADFTLLSLNVTLPLGRGELDILDSAGFPRVEAPMSQDRLALVFSGLFRLNTLSPGFKLTLPRLELTGDGMALTGTGGTPQTLRLFGTEIAFSDFAMTFPPESGFDLNLGETLTLFGKNMNISPLHVTGDGSVADTVLFVRNQGKKINDLLSVKKLAIRSANLQVKGFTSFADPFGSGKEPFSLTIDPSGAWLDDNGDVLKERVWTLAERSPSQSPSVLLGDNDFSLYAYLTGMELGMNGDDNASGDGFLNLQVDTWWPQKTILTSGDSAQVRTRCAFTFTDSTLARAWTLAEGAGQDTLTTLLDSDLFMHAATFSMADTAAFHMNFNAVMQLPLPADLVNGQIELTDNRLEPGRFDFGKLHTAEVSVAGLNLELLDFHYERNAEINSKEIAFSETRASQKDTTYHADLYFSFGARLSTDLPGFQAGVDRFVIFKSDDQFHLLIDNAVIWVGSFIYGELDLVGSIWWKDSGTQFRWLMGGRLDMKMKQVEGLSAVGEISYRETVNVNNQVEVLPGFGLFLAVNTDIDLTPLPISIKGAGAGFFWNPSPEIKDWVRNHLGFNDRGNTDIREEFQAIMDAADDDMMTLWEIYLYGAAAIPDEKFLDAKVLLTLATDRIRLDAKVSPSSDLDLSKVIDLAGWLSAECAWAQDFSRFKYLAGHTKLGGRPAGDKKYILSLPDSYVLIDFIITAEGKFAMSGRINTMVLGQPNLHTDMEFTFGNPGFVFDGGVSYSFNLAQILTVESGVDLMVYLQWLDPVKFGAWASLWVEGHVVSDWLAGFRGEMGAALMGAPDFFLYGYAELTGTVLGVSKTIRAWAKWENGGGVSAGTGADPTLAELVEEARQTAEDIMTAVEELQVEMGLTDVLVAGGLTDEEMRSLIHGFEWGMGDLYMQAWLADVNEIKSVMHDVIDDVDKDYRNKAEKEISDLIDALNDEINPINYNNTMASMKNAVNSLETNLDRIKDDLQTWNRRFTNRTERLAADLTAVDFGLDTLLAQNAGASPLANPLDLSYETLEGVRMPALQVNDSTAARNEAAAEMLRQAFTGWLERVEDNILKIRAGRDEIYSHIGPGGSATDLIETALEPVLSTDDDYLSNTAELNRKFNALYKSYNEITSPWTTDKGFTRLAEHDNHRVLSITRRRIALGQLGISLDNLPSNEKDQYRVLGNMFYRVVPQVLMQNSLAQTDSLMTSFARYYSALQKALDQRHQILTSYTDQLWDKYAELSEKLYAMLDLYREYADAPDLQDMTFTLKDTADALIPRMEDEFSFPSVSPEIRVSATDGFLPVTVDLDFNSDQSQTVSEYAAVFNDNPAQSLADSDRLTRDYVLRHDISYWYETSDAGIAHTPSHSQTRRIEITPRIRNRAGIAAPSRPSIATLSGKNWNWGNPHTSPPDNSVKQKTVYGSSFRCLTFWDTPLREAASVLNDDGQWEDQSPLYYTHERDGLNVKWRFVDSGGRTDDVPLPARHVIEIRQGGRIVFGPQSVPVTEASLPDTFSYFADGLNLTADSGEPVTAHITEYDLDGRVLGASSGSETIHILKDDGSTGSLTKSWRPAALYIDNSPPEILDTEAMRVFRQDTPMDRVIWKFPGLVDRIKTENGEEEVYLAPLTHFDIKLLPAGASEDTVMWRPLKQAGLNTRPSGSSAFFIDLGHRPYSEALTLWLRARNLNPRWNTGYSDPVRFDIPLAGENEKPQPARFEIADLDHNGDLVIEITEAGSDSLSGVDRYPWWIFQNLYWTGNPPVTVWNPDSLYFPADAVRPGARLTIPIPHDSIDSGNLLQLKLFTQDRSGNRNSTEASFQPDPATPEIECRLLEGMAPFTVEVSGPLSPLSDSRIDALILRIGTVPDSADILYRKISLARLSRHVTWRHTSGDSSTSFLWTAPLPESAVRGTSLYVSAATFRDSQTSDWHRQRFILYEPMFETAETDDDGYLVLPIRNSAFNGQREAEFKWAAGHYMPTLDGQNRYQFTVRPFTDLDGVTVADVTPGARLRLPVKAEDLPPRSLIALRAVALDGERDFTYREVDITPPAPQITGRVTMNIMAHDHVGYHLILTMSMGSRIQNGYGENRARVDLRLGTGPGSDDLLSESVTLASATQSKTTTKIFYFSDSLAVLDRVTVTGRSVTALGVSSRDSTVITLDVPRPPICKTARVTFEGGLSVFALRHGHGDPARVRGYQFAVGSGGGSTFDLRAWPASGSSADIAPEAWKPGEDVPLPFSVKKLNLNAYRVGVRALLTDGTMHETVLETVGLLKPEVEPVFIGADTLRIQGVLSAELMDLMYMNELRIHLVHDGTTQFYRNFTVPDNGEIDVSFRLPSDLPRGETFIFRSYYQYQPTSEYPSWETELRLPGDPLFYIADADSADRVMLKIVHEGFNGKIPLAGYQFATGRSKEAQDLRAFPADGVYDLPPEAVRAGEWLTLPLTLTGLSDPAWITLRAVSEEGTLHSTVQSFKPRPPVPEVISLAMDANGRFTARFDPAQFDEKVESMSCWIREDTADPNHTISWTMKDRSELLSGELIFDSHFSDAEDLNRGFVFEGLNFGDMINSYQFEYRFHIEKTGETYRIVPRQ